jgi:Protein of unknown function (DUF3089)
MVRSSCLLALRRRERQGNWEQAEQSHLYPTPLALSLSKGRSSSHYQKKRTTLRQAQGKRILLIVAGSEFPLARKFLYFIAICIALVFAVFLILRLFPQSVSRIAFVPGSAFTAPAPLPNNAYADAALWFERPGNSSPLAGWRPTGVAPLADAPPGKAAVFFIHPTSYLSRAQWNAPLDDSGANDRAINYLRMMASAFTDSGTIWAPRYRQATLGAFLTDKPDGQRALAAAYADVLAAFDHFAAQQPSDAPLILAGHSQGSMHLMRLLRDRVAGTPLAGRVVAAYIVGWPVPVAADLPALGLPACESAEQTGCILSWQSYAEPAGYGDTMAQFEALPGLTGKSRRGDRYLCTNPVKGRTGVASTAADHAGMIRPDSSFATAAITRPGVPARCDAKGFLLIGPGPDLGPFVLPNNNYHAYDYPLFWMNIRADVARRLRAFTAE